MCVQKQAPVRVISFLFVRLFVCFLQFSFFASGGPVVVAMAIVLVGVVLRVVLVC